MWKYLFEYKGSRKILYLCPSKVCKRVQEEMQCMGLTDAVVILSVMPEKTNCYYLQRWYAKWKAYVDVDSTENVVEGDRFSIVRNPAFESIEAVVRSS